MSTTTLLPSCFPATCQSTRGYSFPGNRLCISLCQTSLDSCLPTPPACPDSSKCYYTCVVYQPLLPIWYLLPVCVSPARSLMKLLRGTGASIHSLQYPLEAGVQLDFVLLITTLWTQYFSQFSDYFAVYLSKLYFTSSSRILWETLSKASLKSKHTTSPALPSTSREVISL